MQMEIPKFLQTAPFSFKGRSWHPLFNLFWPIAVLKNYSV